MNRFLLIFTVLLLPISFIAADDIQGHVIVVQPVKSTLLENGQVDLGVVGPGQKLEIEISRSSSIYDFQKTEEIWDRLKIDDNTLPLTWTYYINSLRYEANPKAFVTVAKYADDGTYKFRMETERDYGIAAQHPVSFWVTARVTKDVLDMQILSKQLTAGTNQPAEFQIKLINKGSANDVFNVEVESGLPGKWTFKKKVFVPHNDYKIFDYEVVANEPGTWRDIKFKATSLSSDQITATDTADLQASSSLVQDMKSVANGVILFPYVEQGVYYLLGFIANNFL